jgi:hypothetical protein
VPKALWRCGGFCPDLIDYAVTRGYDRESLPKLRGSVVEAHHRFILESNGATAVISGKFDTPRLFVKTGTV